MALDPHVSRWWKVANNRRQRLINRNAKEGDLTPRQQEEFRMLQKIADLVGAYNNCVFCRKCDNLLEIRDLGYFPTHSCR